jgi:subtilisin-like proprotein convertase family protein
MDVITSWEDGGGATSYRVYFGTDPTPDSSEDKGIRKDTSYDPGTLDYGTTYYWRVDATNLSDTTEGDLWSFTTDPGVDGGVRAEYFADMAPQGTPCLTQIERSIDYNWGNGEVACGLVDMVSVRWTADLTVPMSGAYTFYTTTDDGVRLYLDGVRIIDKWTSPDPEGESPTLELVTGQVYSLVMEYYENTGIAFAQLYWETPAMERQIIPADSLQPPQPPQPWLPWQPSRVVSGARSIPLEGFEHFTDDVAAGTAIFQTWIGGNDIPDYPGNGSGARVGHLNPPYAEQTIVFSGNQSMPLYYDNSNPPYYSQADRTWETPQVWGGAGAQALGLAVHGRAGNDLAQLYVMIEDTRGIAGTEFHPDLDILRRDEWNQWIIPLQKFRDQGVDLGAVKKMSIGMRAPVHWTPFNDLRLYADSNSRAYLDNIQSYIRLLCITVSCDHPLYDVHKAMLTFTPHGGSGNIPVETDDNGYKEIWLAPAVYDINVTAEGFDEKTIDEWDDWHSNGSTDLHIKLTAAVKEYVYGGPPKDIPDDGQISFYLDIEDSGTIADLDVKLCVNHENGADLKVVLSGPDSRSVTLSVDDDGWTDGNETIFDDDSVPTEDDPRYRQPAAGRLDTFDGKDIQGEWKLLILDSSANKVGTLQLWSLLVRLE